MKKGSRGVRCPVPLAPCGAGAQGERTRSGQVAASVAVALAVVVSGSRGRCRRRRQRQPLPLPVVVVSGSVSGSRCPCPRRQRQPWAVSSSSAAAVALALAISGSRCRRRRGWAGRLGLARGGDLRLAFSALCPSPCPYSLCAVASSAVPCRPCRQPLGARLGFFPFSSPPPPCRRFSAVAPMRRLRLRRL